MKPDKNNIYHCVWCESPTATFHEIVYGSLFRQLSIKYNIQVPLCMECHHEAHHGRDTEEKREFFLSFLELNYFKVMHYYQNKRDRYKLEETNEKREKIINSLKIE